MQLSDWPQFHNHILELEQEGLVTRTFRRLDPDRQYTVLNAILDEAFERGPSAVNIKQIASRAGVSVGSLYQYFNNREGLLNFTVEICTRFMSDEFAKYRPILASMPLREGLAGYLTSGFEWSQLMIGLVQFFTRAAYHGDPDLGERLVRPIGTAMRETVRDMLTAATERGELRKDIDLENAARIVHALTIAVGDSYLLPYLNNYFQVFDEKTPIEPVLETMVDLILHGIGAPESGE